MKWRYEFGIEINGRGSKKNRSVEERVEDDCRRTTVSIRGSVGRWWGYGTLKKGECPPEVRAIYEESAREDVAEETRISNLSDEERQKETEEVLRQLRGTPGFFEFHLVKGKG
jgi:hypothetical protein